MEVLFSSETPLSLTSYQSVIHELGRRGHQVTVAIHEERQAGWRSRLLEEVSGPHVTIETGVRPARDRWLDLAADIRSSLDLFEFLGPRFNETYRARAWRRAPRPAAALARSPVASAPFARRAVARALRLAERAMPTNAEVECYLESKRPDVVLFTPYLGLRSIQPDFLRAAQALGLRTAICVKSWDNLTSKSLVRPIPDRLFVWNEVQREEAVTLHGVPAERVDVTGAQCFDEWFRWRASAREDFCARAGLDPGGPFVLYACCSPWTGQSEVDFVRRWMAALRNHPALADLGVLVRPHPKRPDTWLGVDLGDLGVVVFPEEAHAPTDPQSKADYYDSIYHSAAVVGINTSAMIEAAIVGRPVLTVLDPEYERIQQGTLHFRYLLEVGGGLLSVSRTLEEHVEQLAGAVAGAGAGDAAARADRFVEEFVRPHGLATEATPLFVDRIEHLAAEAPPRPRRTPAPLLPLRPLLAPLATRAGRYAAIPAG